MRKEFKMETKVEKLLEKRSQDIKEEWKDEINDKLSLCESPIEKLFLIEFEYQVKAEPYEEYYWIMPQYKINNYRVDFMIYYHYFSKWMTKKNEYPEQNKSKSLIVELDSYLWHGSNPEQFANEKKRERELQKEGWNIMRFSGREIYRNVEKHVEEVFESFREIENKLPEEDR